MKWKWPELARRWKEALGKYQFVLLVLAAGILLFFNHFASWKITEDPTPIEVEMSLYEENLNKTIIQNGERKGADPDGV